MEETAEGRLQTKLEVHRNRQLMQKIEYLNSQIDELVQEKKSGARNKIRWNFERKFSKKWKNPTTFTRTREYSDREERNPSKIAQNLQRIEWFKNRNKHPTIHLLGVTEHQNFVIKIRRG